MARSLVAVAILAAAALQDRGVESFAASGKFACDVQTASRGVRCTPRRSNLITPSVKMESDPQDVREGNLDRRTLMGFGAGVLTTLGASNMFGMSPFGVAGAASPGAPSDSDMSVETQCQDTPYNRPFSRDTFRTHASFPVHRCMLHISSRSSARAFVFQADSLLRVLTAEF